ncbi:hypothetical protein Tsubulata_019493 [Turnera subulata]|uniref:Uncharacterized protein n=1 Tax=Turnera subulata TaxID=218843 RepID=A0A9Q0EZK6_9ROSI|nr:hypothetical protein Tsubulata_019493 [Turnera subulata]
MIWRCVRGSTSQLSVVYLTLRNLIAGDLLDLGADDAFETVQFLLSLRLSASIGPLLASCRNIFKHRKELLDAIYHGLFVLKSDMASNTMHA